MIAIGGRAVLLRSAQLAAAVDVGGQGPAEVYARLSATATAEPVASFFPAPVLAEAKVVCSWLARNAERARLLHVTGSWVALQPPAVGRFAVRQNDEETLIKRSSAVAAPPESIAS